jgi:hypothetical protein
MFALMTSSLLIVDGPTSEHASSFEEARAPVRA